MDGPFVNFEKIILKLFLTKKKKQNTQKISPGSFKNVKNDNHGKLQERQT